MEAIDCIGLQRAFHHLQGLSLRQQQHQLTQPSSQPELITRNSIEWKLKWLRAIEECLGPPVPGERVGLPYAGAVRLMRVSYFRPGLGRGRRYARANGPYYDLPTVGRRQSSLSAQGCPRSLRGFLYSSFCSDLDVVNAHPHLILWLGTRLGAKRTDALRDYVTRRNEWIDEVAAFHKLPSGSSRDLVKRLILRLCYGGAYNAWLRDVGLDVNERKSPRVLSLDADVRTIRAALFASPDWSEECEALRAHVISTRGVQGAALERSVFSHVIQRFEDDALTLAETVAKNFGIRVLALCHDGLIVVRHERVGQFVKLVEAQIYERMGVALSFCEKPFEAT